MAALNTKWNLRARGWMQLAIFLSSQLSQMPFYPIEYRQGKFQVRENPTWVTDCLRSYFCSISSFVFLPPFCDITQWNGNQNVSSMTVCCFRLCISNHLICTGCGHTNCENLRSTLNTECLHRTWSFLELSSTRVTRLCREACWLSSLKIWHLPHALFQRTLENESSTYIIFHLSYRHYLRVLQETNCDPKGENYLNMLGLIFITHEI